VVLEASHVRAAFDTEKAATLFLHGQGPRAGPSGAVDELMLDWDDID